MRYLLLADIHANREALEAVLADAAGQYDRVLCLGDLVGYGADPNFVVDWARAEGAAIIRGNHDRVGGDASLESYRADVREGLMWTRQALSPANLDYLRELPQGPLSVNGFDLVHGSPLDEDQYVKNAGEAAQLLPHLEKPLTFFGHTHVQGGFLVSVSGALRIAPEGPLTILPDQGRYLVNPGSVGQPRDGNWRAAYAIYAEGTVEFRRVAYPVGRTAEKIALAGMPVMQAARLLMGK